MHNAKYGLANSTVDWFRNYLSDRSQCTVFKGVLSSQKTVSCGVPQGSILGPLLFVIYLNDLPQVLMNSRISLYADDTAVYYESGDILETQLMLQQDMELINNWMRVNKLSLNVKKSKSMLFSRRRADIDAKLEIVVDDVMFKQVESFKYLGLYLDPKLNFNQHIKNTCAKARYKLSTLGRCRQYISQDISLLLYKSLVLLALPRG